MENATLHISGNIKEAPADTDWRREIKVFYGVSHKPQSMSNHQNLFFQLASCRSMQHHTCARTGARLFTRCVLYADNSQCWCSFHRLQSYMFSGQEEERSVLLGVGRLEFVAEPEPPFFLQLQPAHRLPQRATICTDDAQSRSYGETDQISNIKPTRIFPRPYCERNISSLFFIVFRSCTFEEGELLEESRGHKGVSKTEEEAAKQQPCGADVDRVRSGAHKTHGHL